MPFTASSRQPDPPCAGWFAGAAGQAILASEAALLQGALHEGPAQATLWFTPDAARMPAPAAQGGLMRLCWAAQGFDGDLRCGLPLPLASESCGRVIVQHVADAAADPMALLEECSRVLLPGGRLWLLALNPLAPYRVRWRANGLRSYEPVTWRRRLRTVGLAPDPVSQGLGPTWRVASDAAVQDGAGLRAAFLLRAEKRRSPLTPAHARRAIGWQPGTA